MLKVTKITVAIIKMIRKAASEAVVPRNTFWEYIFSGLPEKMHKKFICEMMAS